MIWYFLRHAKTEREAKSGKDVDRKLAPKGIKQCEEMLVQLASLPIGKVLCSSAQRTKETAIACLPMQEIQYKDSLYLASVDEWRLLVAEQAADQTLFIGHNDGISAFITWLTGEFTHLQTAALVTVEFHGSDPAWLGPATATVRSYYRPVV